MMGWNDELPDAVRDEMEHIRREGGWVQDYANGHILYRTKDGQDRLVRVHWCGRSMLEKMPDGHGTAAGGGGCGCVVLAIALVLLLMMLG